MTLDEGHYYIYFCCNNLWKSKFMVLEKPGKIGEFFSYFVGTLSKPWRLIVLTEWYINIACFAKTLHHFYHLFFTEVDSAVESKNCHIQASTDAVIALEWMTTRV